MTIALPPSNDDDDKYRLEITGPVGGGATQIGQVNNYLGSASPVDPYQTDRWKDQEKRLAGYVKSAVHVADRPCPGVEADVRPPSFRRSVRARVQERETNGIADHVLSHTSDCLITG